MEKNITYGFILAFWLENGTFLKTGKNLAGELTMYSDKKEVGGVAMDRENNVFIVDPEKSKFKNKQLFLSLRCESEGKKTKIINFTFEIMKEKLSIVGKWNDESKVLGWAGIMFLPSDFGGYFYGK